MSEKEIIKICKLICGTKKKNGKREYKTVERMNLLKNYTEDELEEAIEDLLDLYNKQKEEIEQKDIMIEAFKNAIGNILQGKKLCKEIKGGTTIRINLVEEKEKRIENALLYLKTMEETEDTYELEKILKGE